MIWSTIWIYVAYIFAPQTPEVQNSDEWNDVIVENSNTDEESVEIVLPEVDPENPTETDAPILITEDWELDEMNQTIEVQLQNWETELVRLWDLWNSIQIN